MGDRTQPMGAMLWLACGVSAQYHLSTKDVNLLLEKKHLTDGIITSKLGSDEFLSGFVTEACQLLWFDVASQSRWDRWALPSSCWTPSTRSVNCLSSNYHNIILHVVMRSGSSATCCTYISGHECLLWINRADLHCLNKKRWDSIYCVIRLDNKSVFSHCGTWIWAWYLGH